MISRIAMAVPLLGKLSFQAFVARFCRTLATLLEGGVSIVESLDILSTTTRNAVIKLAITSTRESIIGGVSISLSMVESGVFPNMLTKMVQIGEQSGSLPKVLNRISIFYERKVEASISTLTSILGPVIIVVIGAIVMVVVFALYLPIFSMSNINM